MRSVRSSAGTCALGSAISWLLVGVAVANGDPSGAKTPDGATPSATADASAEAVDAMEGVSLRGQIPGLTVEVTSAIAYRDWMPGGSGFRGEDGGSPLHVVIGLSLANTGSAPLRLDRTARLGAVGEAMTPIPLDDLSGATAWPVVVAPGAVVRFQLGTREGPMLPVATAVALEIDLISPDGDALVISFDSLAVGRTD